MANYEMDEVVEQSPVEPTETVETGQEKVKTESEKVEVPETGETSTSEAKAESEVDTKEVKTEDNKKTETTEDKTDKKPLTKKASEQFTTDPQALKAAENLAIALREDVNFKKMTIEQTREWYDENRPRLGKEGFKGDRSKAKELNQTIKEEDKFTRLESKLDNFLETQKPKEKEESEVKPLTAPIAPEFDEEKYNDLVLEDPRAAAQMMREYRNAQNDYINQRIEFEAFRLVDGIKPMVEGYAQLTKKEQEAEQAKTNKREWDDAEKTIRNFIKEQPEGMFKYSFDECEDDMKRLMNEDWAAYRGIIEAEGKERALFRLYQNALREKEGTETSTRLAELEAEIAALKNGETIDQINATKGAARISATNGGVTPKTPQKPKTPQEIFEEQMRGNSHTRSKYDLET